MLSKTSEYALRAVVALAGHPAAPLLSPQLAEITGVRPAYLQKVMQILARSDLVRSQRGPGGGFTLARPASQVSVLDVLNAVEPIKRIQRCPLGIVSHATLCPLHRKLDDALASVERAFGSTTLDQLLSSKGGPAPLCPTADRRHP